MSDTAAVVDEAANVDDVVEAGVVVGGEEDVVWKVEDVVDVDVSDRAGVVDKADVTVVVEI